MLSYFIIQDYEPLEMWTVTIHVHTDAEIHNEELNISTPFIWIVSQRVPAHVWISFDIYTKKKDHGENRSSYTGYYRWVEMEADKWGWSQQDKREDISKGSGVSRDLGKWNEHTCTAEVETPAEEEGFCSKLKLLTSLFFFF